MNATDTLTSASLLRVEGLTYLYGKRRAVDDVTFEVRRGECFGLLGPNGAGKTTTISCMVGLLADWTGHMDFEGVEFNPSKVPLDRGKLGFVPQDLAVYNNLTAEENLVLFSRLCGLPKADVSNVVEQNLELAGLTDRRKDLVRTFSGGMKRRLNLAAGLLHEPDLILLDEPTVGVDPQSRNHLFETLLHLKAQGASLLYTTHYMEEAQRLCDRIAIMNEGKVVAIGTATGLAEEIGQPDANLEQVFLHHTGRSLRDE